VIPYLRERHPVQSIVQESVTEPARRAGLAK
jgi:hypothetical protein